MMHKNFFGYTIFGCTLICLLFIGGKIYFTTQFRNSLMGKIAFSNSVDVYIAKPGKMDYQNKLLTQHRLEIYPAISHDGTKLALCVEDLIDQKSFNSLLIIENLKGYFEEYKIIYQSEKFEEQIGQISWSPDDKAIAYLSGVDVHYPSNRCERQLNIFDVEHLKIIKTITGYNLEACPTAWPSEGECILFSTWENKIMRYDLSLDRVYDVTAGSAPQCSPKDKIMLFSDSDNIYLSDLEGKNKKILIKNYGGIYLFTKLVWSPNGEHFLYVREGRTILFNIGAPTVDLIAASIKNPQKRVRLFSIGYGFTGLSWSK